MSCTSPKCFVIPPPGTGLKARYVRNRLEWKPAGTRTPSGWTYNYLPCGGCLACRIERRQEITILQMLEASLHDENWFLTLTFDDSRINFPIDRTNYKWPLSSFNESMRLHYKYLKREYRYFACGEYGDKFGRPHYHLSIFGLSGHDLGLHFDSDDERRRRDTLFNGSKFRSYFGASVDSDGRPFWQSPVVVRFWPFGNHKLYRATRETFQYVAGYVVKKLTGKANDDHDKLSAFQVQSRPSIGFPWWQLHRLDLSVIDRDKLVNDGIEIDGLKWKIPRIMNRWLTYNYPLVDYEQIRARRVQDAPDYPDLKACARKAAYLRYRAASYENKNTHKEIT